MSKATIAVDIDDVLVESAPNVINYYNSKYGTNVKLTDFYKDDLLRIWKVPDRETAIRRVNEYLSTDEYMTLPATLEALNVLTMIKQNYDLHIVTGRPADITEQATLNWLNKNFPEIFRTVVFSNYYALDKKQYKSKADICLDLGATILIDDHLDHALQAEARGVKVLLFGDYPRRH